MDAALLLVRVVVGLLFAGHGLQKLVGWFGGGGLNGTGAYLEAFGFRKGRFWAGVGGLSEAVGGALLALGLLSPLAAAAVIGTMLVASRTQHKGNGLWVYNNGSEYPVVLAAVAAGLAIGGPGEWSLDAALGWSLHGAEWGIAAVVGGLGIGLLTLASRTPQPALASTDSLTSAA